ncbi:MAG: phytanoyl-CoA dioxygenase family protein [Deltaproteobacteria bacterium]|nr:phytanoyl-CoA dioxygenase family protein [Deltaproteobacteria bacterium]
MTDVEKDLHDELERPYPLSPEQIEAFRRDGFIRLPNVFSAELLEHFGALITSVVEAEDPNELPLAERGAYARAFTQITNLWQRHPAVVPFSSSRRCARIACELLGCEGVRMWHDQALFKEASGGITPWHVDQFFWPMSSDQSITAWIPFQETSVESGALQFAVGTHHSDHGRRSPTTWATPASTTASRSIAPKPISAARRAPP